ncbi:MAG: chalcone isomerase family protein [Bdellovibrionales bacterium]
MMRNLILVSALFLGPASVAFAKPNFPDKITVEGKELLRQGQGTRKFAFWSVYDAALYVEQPGHYDPKSPETKVLRMHFLRDVSQKDSRGAMEKGLGKSCGKDCKLNFDELFANVQPVKEGDVHEYVFMNDETRIDQAGHKNVYHVPGFSAVVLGTWIGDYPPTESLKKGLLGK